MNGYISEIGEMHSVICGTCGIIFAIPALYAEIKKDTESSFFCPNGHPISFPKNISQKEKSDLQKENVQLKHNLEQMETKLSEKD